MPGALNSPVIGLKTQDAASELPNEFIQPSKAGNGKNIHCTTEEVQSLNTRAQDNIRDLLFMTHERIQDLLDVARSMYDAFARVSDAIALLDLCHGFADKVTLSKEPWVRPDLLERDLSSDSNNKDQDMIDIRNGRYGIESPYSVDTKVVPNDTFCSRSKTFTIITGINGSGKSTYLKQIAVIVLLAHCGSYVPAEKAKVPVSRTNGWQNLL
jgi:DNA mismatch repair protein MSH4